MHRGVTRDKFFAIDSSHLISRRTFLLPSLHQNLAFVFSLLLNLILLELMLQVTLFLFNPFLLSDHILAFIDVCLVLIVKGALASRFNWYHEQLILLLQSSLCKMMAVNYFAAAIHNETLLDLWIWEVVWRWSDDWTHLVLSIQMGFFVSCKIGRLSEPFVAAWVRAEIWLLSCVSAQVGPQIKIKRKLFPAKFAFERFFTLSNYKYFEWFTVWTSWCRLSLELSRNLFPQPSTGQIYFTVKVNDEL